MSTEEQMYDKAAAIAQKTNFSRQQVTILFAAICAIQFFVVGN